MPYYIFLFVINLVFFITCKAKPVVKSPQHSHANIPIEPKVESPKEYKLDPLIELPSVLSECSGMIALGNKFLAHNDSGNKPYLYLFNRDKPEEVKTIKVLQVTNNDWEELASDDEFIYIGDFGNNGGKRQNLMIYKIKRALLENNAEVTPEIIHFSYSDQKKFNDSNMHNFDCEAMIAKGDSLFLFSKNRGDFRTDLYGLPKVPGEYVLSKSGSFDTEGLVTGADFISNGATGQLALVGYAVHGKALYPFIYYFPDVKGSKFLSGDVQKIVFRDLLQTETIFFHDKSSLYISNEEEDGSEGFIYEVKI